MRETKNFLIENLNLIPKERLKESELVKSMNELESLFQTKGIDSVNKKFFEEKYEIYNLTLDSLILWNINLTNIMLSESPELKSNLEPTQKGYFTHLQIHLTNNLFAVKHLLNLGLDTQAKSVYRNSIEISDLALVVLNKKDFFKNHIKPNLNKKGNPFISPKNKTIASNAESILIEINNIIDKGANSKNVIDIYWKAIRREHYANLSESAHGNFYQNIQNSFKKTVNYKFISSIGGGKWLNMEKSLSDLCLHQIALKSYLTWSLDLKHNIDLFDNSTLSHKLIWYIDVVIGKKLLRELIKPMYESN
jgi:hypothetical protein